GRGLATDCAGPDQTAQRRARGQLLVSIGHVGARRCERRELATRRRATLTGAAGRPDAAYLVRAALAGPGGANASPGPTPTPGRRSAACAPCNDPSPSRAHRRRWSGTRRSRLSTLRLPGDETRRQPKLE